MPYKEEGFLANIYGEHYKDHFNKSTVAFKNRNFELATTEIVQAYLIVEDSQHIVEQINCLLELIKIYLCQSNLMAAIQLAHCVLDMYETYITMLDTTFKQEGLVQICCQVEQQLLQTRYDCVSTSDVIKENMLKGREKLRNIRNSVKERIIANQETSSHLLKYISQEFISMTQDMIQQCMEVLGKPPIAYAIVGLGSMSRQEMCLFSDVELAVLVEETSEQVFDYFTQLFELLNIKFITLGETPCKVLGLPILPALPQKGFSLDSIMLGMPETFISTPLKLADYQLAEDSQVDVLIRHSLRRVCYVSGEPTLFKTYQDRVNKLLDTLDPKEHRKTREIQALNMMQNSLTWHGPRLDKAKEIARHFNIKDELYRLASNILIDLATYYHIESSNAWEIIDVLYQRKIISKEGNKNLKSVMDKIILYRLKTQLHYQAEYEDVFHSQQDREESSISSMATFSMERDDIDELLEIYKVLLPLQSKAQMFLDARGHGIKWNKDHFYDLDLIEQGKQSDEGGDYPTALERFQAATAIDPDNPEKLIKLASILNQFGKHQEALQYCHRVFDSTQDVQIKVSCLMSLAVIYESQSDYKKALEWLEEALKFNEKATNNKKAKEAKILMNISILQQRLGHLEVAFTICLKAQELFDKNSNKGEKARFIDHLGNIYLAQSEYKKAEEMFKKAFKLNKKVYGMQHVNTAESLSNLTLVEVQLGKNKNANQVYEQIIEIFRMTYGNEYPAIALIFTYLGDFYLARGNSEMSVLYFSKALALNIKLHGENHSLSAQTLFNLGNAYSAYGNHKRALEYMLKALPISKKLQGDEHPTLILMINSIGAQYENLGEVDKAIEEYEAGISLAEKIDLHTHSGVADLLCNLGNCKQRKGQHEEGLKHYERALEIYKSVYGKENIRIATIYNNIAAVYSRLNRADEAIKLCMQALKIKEREYGGEHREVAKSYTALGNIYKHQEKHDIAIEKYQHAMQIFKKNKEVFGMDYALTLSGMGDAYGLSGAIRQAITHLHQAYIIIKISQGDTHAQTLAVRDRLMHYLSQQDIYSTKYNDPTTPKTLEEEVKSVSQTPAEELLKEAGLLLIQGNHAQALESCNKVLESNPQLGTVNFMKVACLEALGRLDEALTCLDYVTLSELKIPALQKKTVILTKLNRLDDAMLCIDITLALGSVTPDSLFAKATLYLRMGNRRAATSYLDNLLTHYPDYQPAIEASKNLQGSATNKYRFFAEGTDDAPGDDDVHTPLLRDPRDESTQKNIKEAKSVSSCCLVL